MIEQNNWIDEMFTSKWFLVENIAKVSAEQDIPRFIMRPSYLRHPERTKVIGSPIFNAGLARQLQMDK